MNAPNLRGLALLSIGAAIATIGMKAAAYGLTGSSGLLADALEACLNLLAAGTTYCSLWYASRPVDSTHTYGHEKIEFFASGLEGGFVVMAGIGTAGFAALHFINPPALTNLDLGGALAAASAVINLVIGRLLIHSGRRNRSLVIEADGAHLIADFYTTAAVVSGLVLVRFTGWLVLDPLIALAVGVHIFVIGFQLIRRSFNGLMDHAWPVGQQDQLRGIIRSALPEGADFHALRTRQAGRRSFAEFHLLLAGSISVREAHRVAHQVEEQLVRDMPGVFVTIHIEPIDEAESFEQEELRALGESR